MRSRISLSLILPALLACAHPTAPPIRGSSPAPVPTADDVFAALKARDPARLSAVLAANPPLAGARRPDGTSAIAASLFTLNDDEETFVRPPDNVLLRSLVGRHPPLDIYDAAATGDLSRLRALLDREPALANAVHPSLGITPLHFAAFGGAAPAVALLIERGSVLDAPSHNKFHNTALLLSVLSDEYDTAAVLLAKGANVEAVEDGGERAVHLAAEEGDVRLLALLLDHGAAVDAKTDGGETPLVIATKRGKAQAANLLRARGAR